MASAEQVVRDFCAAVSRRDPEALRQFGIIGQELPEANGTGQAGRSGADHQHPDLDAGIGRVGRFDDEVAGPKRRRRISEKIHRPINPPSASVT